MVEPKTYIDTHLDRQPVSLHLWHIAGGLQERESARARTLEQIDIICCFAAILPPRQLELRNFIIILLIRQSLHLPLSPHTAQARYSSKSSLGSFSSVCLQKLMSLLAFVDTSRGVLSADLHATIGIHVLQLAVVVVVVIFGIFDGLPAAFGRRACTIRLVVCVAFVGF